MNSKMAITTYLPIITLNVNGLNAPIKRHKVAEWIRNQESYICATYKIPNLHQNTHRLKVKGYKKIFHENEDEKQKLR